MLLFPLKNPSKRADFLVMEIIHGGSFERVPHLLYTKSEVYDVYMDPDYMSVDEV